MILKMKKSTSSPVQWCMLIIPATKRLRQEERLFEASLGNLARPRHTHTLNKDTSILVATKKRNWRVLLRKF